MTPDPRIKKPVLQPAIDLYGVVGITKPGITLEQLNLAPDTLFGLKNICQDYKSGYNLLCLFAGNSGAGQRLVAERLDRVVQRPTT